MRLSCSVSDMSGALGTVTRAIAPRSTNQIMEGVLLTSCPEGLRLTCTDLALGIETYIDAEILEEGSIVLPGKLFAEIVRKLPEGMMEIAMKDERVVSIRASRSRTTLSFLAAEEFPALPEVGQSQTIAIESALLKDMISRTTFAIATDETRPILTGCLIDASDRELTMVALDGFRLALRKQRFEEDIPTLSAVVPGKVLNEIARILDDSQEKISLLWGSTHLLVNMGRTRVVARLLEGEFIRYQQILPTEWQTRVVAVKKEVESALDRASLMAREGKNNLVKLHVQEGMMLITSNAELGDVREELQLDTEGRDLDIAFNVRYMTETLRAIEDDNIQIRFNSNVSPCVLLPTSGDHYLYLALPVRVFSA